MKINIQDLYYVLALSKTCHFGQAAKQCHVTQSNLSNQLKRLENSLGATLFERSKKHVRLTDFGERFIAQAKDIVERMQVLETIREDPFSGTLKLGIFPTLAPYLLQRCMPALTDTFPRLRFILSEEKTADLIAQLEQGELDCIVAASPLDKRTFTAQPLFTDPFCLAVYKGHPLAQKKTIRLSALQNEALLLLEEGHCLRDQALSVCHLSGIQIREDYRATSLETLRYMVAAKVGITLIPDIAISAANKHAETGIIYLPFTAPKPQREIALFWRKTNSRDAVYKKIGECIEKQVKRK